MKQLFNSAKNYCQAAFFFPFANVFNYAHGHDQFVTTIAIINFFYSTLSITALSIINNLPHENFVRVTYNKIVKTVNEIEPTKNFFVQVTRIICREMTDLNRFTSYCCFAVSGLLLQNACSGAHVALLPGITAAAFGLGNYCLSSKKLARLRSNPNSNPVLRAVINPAISYGAGYATTGLTIGGPQMIANPFGHLSATLLTSVGILETVGALGVMAFGKIRNQAVPFMIVASGGALFSVTGFVMGDHAGAATGALACCGELSLAVLMQKIHNGNVLREEVPPKTSIVERVLTKPIRAAMNAGIINRYLHETDPS